jgi:hypothetical protein
LLNTLLIIAVLILAGLIAAGLRWGQLGVYLFGAVGHRLGESLRAAWAARRHLWTNPLLRLALLALVVLLADWAADAVQRGGVDQSVAVMDKKHLEPRRDERSMWRDRSYYGLARLTIGETAGPVDTYARQSYQFYLRDWIWKETDRGHAFERERDLRRRKLERERERERNLAVPE